MANFSAEMEKYPQVSPVVSHVLFALLLLITAVAIVFNGLIIYIYSRSPSRKKKLFILNLAVSELLCPVLNYWMVLSSTYQGHWLYGSFGCVTYAFSTGFFSMTSIGCLVAMAVERYTVCHFFTHRHMRIRTKYLIICGTWVYGLLLTIPPLCGWGRYVVDIYKPSCTYDYYSHETNTQTFMAYLVIGGFLLPAAIIVFCYVSMFRRILENEKTMEHLALRPSVKCHFQQGSNKQTTMVTSQQFAILSSPSFRERRHSSALSCKPQTAKTLEVPSQPFRHSFSLNDVLISIPENGAKPSLPVGQRSPVAVKISNWNVPRSLSRTEIQFAKLTLMVIFAFFICWTPYATLTILCQFRVDAAFNPTAAAITLLFAKSSVAINPIIYAFKERKFRLEVIGVLQVLLSKLRRTTTAHRQSEFKIDQY